MLSSLWANWLDELFLLSFRRGIIDVLDFHTKSITIQISEEVKKLAQPFMKEIDTENEPDHVIIETASEMMVSIASVNRAIDVIHPGNTAQYFSLPVEYGVIFINLGILSSYFDVPRVFGYTRK